MAHVKCPRCEQRLRLDTIKEKQRVRCPACKHEFIVSPPSQPPPLPGNHTGNSHTAPQPENIAPQQPQSTDGIYGGIGRLPYFGLMAGLTITMIVVSNSVSSASSAGRVSGGGAMIIWFVFIVCSYFFVYYRLENIGWSPWWSLLILLPPANLGVGILCLVCPEGYDDIKKLDTAGKVIAYILVGLLIVPFVAALIIWNIA